MGARQRAFWPCHRNESPAVNGMGPAPSCDVAVKACTLQDEPGGMIDISRRVSAAESGTVLARRIQGDWAYLGALRSRIVYRPVSLQTSRDDAPGIPEDNPNNEDPDRSIMRYDAFKWLISPYLGRKAMMTLPRVEPSAMSWPGVATVHFEGWAEPDFSPLREFRTSRVAIKVKMIADE
jgi:hypothetical protein